MTARQQRVAEAVKEEISDLIQNEMKDPRIGLASVVRAEISRDLRVARVYVSVLGDDEDRKRCLAGLKSATGFLRSELAKRIRLRVTPELEFRMDDSIEHGVHIARILRDLKHDTESE